MFGGEIIGYERSFRLRLAKIVFGSGFLAVRWAESGIFKDQGSRRQPRQPGLTRGIALIPV
jgi:hypothetical protein